MRQDMRLRCWDKGKKIMLPSFPLYKACFAHYDRTDEMIIMLGTGIKDRTGKEIYEGDIVVGKGYLYFDDGKPNYVAVVEWCFAGFHTVLRCINPNKRGISDGINEPLEDGKLFEVIGNIYQDSHLLDKDKWREANA